jgi:MerR family Zn(II)-responsive transcriptional regulator of zntA
MVHSQVHEEQLLIGEYAQQVGSTKDTVRFYVRLGLLVPASRQAGNREYAVFAQSDIERFGLIEQGKAMGFTLDEIRTLLDASERGQLTARQQRLVIETKLEEIRARLKTLKTFERYLAQKLASLDD